MISNLKELLSQKKKEQKENLELETFTDEDEIRRLTRDDVLEEFITELTELINSKNETLKIDIKDIDGKQLKSDSIIQLLNEDEEPFDDEISTIRVVSEYDKYTVRAFEKNHSYTALSDDTYAPLFRIVN